MINYLEYKEKQLNRLSCFYDKVLKPEKWWIFAKTEDEKYEIIGFLCKEEIVIALMLIKRYRKTKQYDKADNLRDKLVNMGHSYQGATDYQIKTSKKTLHCGHLFPRMQFKVDNNGEISLEGHVRHAKNDNRGRLYKTFENRVVSVVKSCINEDFLHSPLYVYELNKNGEPIIVEEITPCRSVGSMPKLYNSAKKHNLFG